MSEIEQSFDTKLIQAVEPFEFIYNKKHLLFKNNLAKENAWKTIAKTLGRPGKEADIAKRWSTLRKRFIEMRKKVKNLPSGSGAEDANINWNLFNMLQFLNKHVALRITSTNISQSDDLSSDTATDKLGIAEETRNNSEVIELITIEDEADLSVLSERSKDMEYIYSVNSPQNLPSTSKSQPNASQVRPTPNRSLKRKLDNTSEGVSQSIDKALTKFGNFLEKRSEPVRENAMEAFSRSIAYQMNLIRSPVTQLQLQSKICLLLSDALEKQELESRHND